MRLTSTVPDLAEDLKDICLVTNVAYRVKDFTLLIPPS